MTKKSDEVPVTRRRLMIGLLGLGLLAPLGACGKGNRRMGNGINLSVVMYSYLNRPVFDIFLNKEDLGASGPYGSTGIITGAQIPFGPQTLSWRIDGPPGTPNNGDTVHVRNVLTVRAEQILSKTRYLGLHIYPDYTAEIVLCDDMPDRTVRGEKILKDAGIDD